MQDIYPSRHAPEPAMLPRLDPVVNGTWSPSSPLSRQQADQFERDGYLILQDLFSDAEIASLQQESHRLLAGPDTLDRATMITEPGSNDIRSIFAIHQQSLSMERLVSDRRMVDVAAFLLGDDVYVHQSRLNYKPGFSGREFYWHSDFETWHVEDGMPRMRALSMSVLLAENTEHNGPLMLIPGSHHFYVACVGETPADHYRTSLKKQEYGVPDADSLAELVERHGIVSATGKPGSVVVFDCNLMHGSNGNITPLPRSNAFFVYNALTNRLQQPFGAEKPRPEFIAARQQPRPLIALDGPIEEIAA